MAHAISRRRASAVKPGPPAGPGPHYSAQVPPQPVDKNLMTRALLAALLLAIPFVISVILVRRAGFPGAGQADA